MPELTMTAQVFAIFNGLIEERLGLWYALTDKPLLESKLSTRALELGFESLLDYYYYLRYDDADLSEFDRLTTSLVVNETFFFREYDQLNAVLSKFIVPRIQAGARPRIWCAACATGEEPATIAMWLDQRGLLPQVELIASDVSAAALSIAHAGRYRQRALRSIPAGVEPTRWISDESGTLVLQPRIREAICWRKLNLLDADAVRSLGMLDLVLCRNVLIYFRQDATRRVVAQLSERLQPHGVLLVGVSESLLRFGTALHCEEHDGVFVYRKGQT